MFYLQLTEERCNAIANDIAAGSQYMHTRTPPIIHRDIKPPLNVMVRNCIIMAYKYAI